MRKKLLIVTTLLLSSMPNLAHASEASRIPFTTALVGTGVALVGGGVTITVGVITTQKNKREKEEQLRRYLDENEQAVRQTMALGGGTAIADLGDLLGVPEEERAAFGKRLRNQRVELLRAAYVDDHLEGWIALGA